MNGGGKSEGVLRRIGNIGVTPGMDPDHVRRIRTVNLYSLGLGPLIAAYAPVSLWLLESPALAIGDLLICAACAGPLALNRARRYGAAIAWLLVLSNVSVVTYSIALGNRSGIHLVFLMLAAVSTLVIDQANRRASLAALGTPLALLIATYSYGTQHPAPIPIAEPILDLLYLLLLVTVVMMVMFILVLYATATRGSTLEMASQHARVRDSLGVALRESEGRYQQLVRQAADALLLVDVEGCVIDANDQAIAELGLDSPLREGRHIWDFDHSFEPEGIPQLVSQLQTGEGYRAEHEYQRLDGSLFPAEVSVGLITTGQTHQLLISARDISRQREMQSQLMLAERMASVGTLAAGVAHEINNPLTYMLMNAEMLEKRLETPLRQLPENESAPIRQGLARVQEAADRVARIVRDLMTFARDDDAEVSAVDVRHVLERTLALAEGELKACARVHTDFGDVPLALGSSSRLGQIFLNLLINAAHALKASGVPSPRIDVRTMADENGNVVVTFRDNGPGMSEDIAGHIFEPFYTTKGEADGTGLGLFMCRKLLSALGGTIEVRTAPGEGANFVVTLKSAASRHGETQAMDAAAVRGEDPQPARSPEYPSG